MKSFTFSFFVGGACVLLVNLVASRMASRESKLTIAPGFHPAAAYMASMLHGMKANSDQEIHFGHVKRPGADMLQLSDQDKASHRARYAVMSSPIPPIPHMKDHVQTRAEIEQSLNSELFHTPAVNTGRIPGKETQITKKSTYQKFPEPKNLVDGIPKDMFQKKARVTSLASDVLSKKGVNVGYRDVAHDVPLGKKDKLEEHGVYTNNRLYQSFDDIAVPLEGIDANGYFVHPDAYNREGYTVNEYWPLQANGHKQAMETKLASSLENYNGIPELKFSPDKPAAVGMGKTGGRNKLPLQLTRKVATSKHAQTSRGLDEAWLAAGSQEPLGVENVVNSVKAAGAMEDGVVDAKEKSEAMANLRNAMMDSHQTVPGHRERWQIARAANPCQEQQPYESYFAYKFRLAHGGTSRC